MKHSEDKFSYKNLILISLVFLVVILGFMLRRHNYQVFPREGATFDEFAWTFLGLSIVQTGTPISWSPHKAYTATTEYYNDRGTHFTLVRPYLEHPPLFGIVAGVMASIRGVRTFDQVTIQKIRPLGLILGSISMIAVFMLANELYGYIVGLISIILYSIVPTLVIGSRLVQNENFFIPFFMLSLFFLSKYVRTQKYMYFIVSTAICCLLPLAKVPWVAASVTHIFLLLYFKKYKDSLVVCISTAVVFLLYFLYGYVMDAALFFRLWKMQLMRYDMAFDSILLLIRDPLLVDRTYVDGWIYAGWVVFLWQIGKKSIQKHIFIITAIVSYGLVYIYAIPGEPMHGWYRYPFYPFLIILLAAEYIQTYRSSIFHFITLSFIIGLPLLQNTWGRLYGFSYPLHRGFISFVLITFIFSLSPIVKMRRFAVWGQYAITLSIIALSIFSIFIYAE